MSNNYWTKRFSEEENQRNISNKAQIKEIERQYKIAENKIKSDIEKWYIRIADNNKISLADAKKLLTKNELEEFKWTLEEYTKKAKSEAWKKELENASARMSREMACKESLQGAALFFSETVLRDRPEE